MKHDVPFLTSGSLAPSVVTVLPCDAPLRIDPTPLSEIYADKGPDAAEDTICRVLEDIAHRLNTLQSLRRACVFADLVRPAQRLAVVADQIGLTEISLSANHVATAAGQGDAVALEATLSRLERGFDSAISQIWDVQHISS